MAIRMRKSFRDFMQKAESSGPGTVAMVYLSGYALQYVGENYFVPVNSNISRDTDIPVEGLGCRTICASSRRCR